VGILLQPFEGAVRHHAGASFRENAGKLAFLLFSAHVIVISIKSMREAEVLGHGARAHKRRRGKARRLGERSDGGMGLVENEAAHVAQAMDSGICPGHDASVRRKGERHLRRGVQEQNATGGEGIQVRRERITSPAARSAGL
jgi:hypothetical protein